MPRIGTTPLEATDVGGRGRATARCGPQPRPLPAALPDAAVSARASRREVLWPSPPASLIDLRMIEAKCSITRDYHRNPG